MIDWESAKVVYRSNQIIEGELAQLSQDLLVVFFEKIDFDSDTDSKIFIIEALFPGETFADIFFQAIQLYAPGIGVVALVRGYDPVIAEAEFTQAGGFCSQNHFFGGRAAIAPGAMIVVGGRDHIEALQAGKAFIGEPFGGTCALVSLEFEDALEETGADSQSCSDF